jgi:hypothetical protein
VHSLKRIAESLLNGLASTGLRQLDERWDPESFGSGLILLGRSKPELRLVWDGKDEWAWLQTRSTSGAWVDASGPMRKGDFPFGVPNAEKLDHMAQVARSVLS